MPRPRKVTAEQLAHARKIDAERRALLRKLEELPSIGELARGIGCSERHLRALLAPVAAG